MGERVCDKIMRDLAIIANNSPEQMARAVIVQADALHAFLDELTGPNMVSTKATKETTFAGLRIVANPYMHPDMFGLVDEKNQIITVQYWRNRPSQAHEPSIEP